MSQVSTILEQATVIPVMVIDTLDGIEDFADCLSSHGMTVLEITLRTEMALHAVQLIKTAHPHLLVGTGTNLSIPDINQSIAAGADFMVSPGATTDMLDYAGQRQLPLLPGVATASEVMTAMSYGFDHLKLFPAQAVGGVPLLKSLAGPLPTARFCPTGGISGSNASDYLKLPNVMCVGGSWMLDKELIETKNWSALGELLAQMNSELEL